MLKAQIAGCGFDLAQGWGWDDGRWTAPCGWMEPFAHEALEHQMVVRQDGAAAFLVVRERAAGTGGFAVLRAGAAPRVLPAPAFEEQRRAAAEWPIGFTLVDLEGGETRPGVRVSCGATGEAPLQFAAADGVLHLSWDLLDLEPVWSVNRLNVEEATRFVSLRTLYSPATLFSGVRTLTERASAFFDGAEVSVTLPAPAMHARPRTLRQDADPVPVFERLLEEVTARWRATSGHVAVELSGGMDSAVVAAALSDVHGPVHTAVMRLPGEAGVQQMQRRASMIEVLGLGPDHVVAVADHAPFCPGGSRRVGRWSPNDGNYVEATAVFQRELVEAGVTTVFTGAAGDDMVGLRPEEVERLGQRRPVRPIPGWLGKRAREVVPVLAEGAAPVPVLKYSVLAGLEPRFPQTMRQGLWPVSPLAAPELARFGESLPLEWRRHKRLIRQALARRGLSDPVVWPVLRENFAPVMEIAMRRWGIGLLADLVGRGSVLADQGIIDPDAVLEACRDGRAGGPVRALYRPLMLETALRSLAA